LFQLYLPTCTPGIAGLSSDLTGIMMESASRFRPFGRRKDIMHIPVLIEQVDSNGYRVTTGQPLTLSAEGATREEALQQMRKALQARLSSGAEIASLEVSAAEHPLAPYAGMFKDNPLFDAWQQSIAAYRRQIDEDQECP